MHARLSTVLILGAGLMLPALVLSSTGADAACLARHALNCVDLTLPSDVSQQLAGLSGDPQQAPSATLPSTPAADSTPYTGPTIGLNSMVRRAPEIGYRWSIE
jgi:hypothetical protein